jgi:V/A-type H+-transporting ATPase subunit D
MANPLNINPNRMELMKLTKRRSLAKRGHRLLKDKQDNLMDRFTKVIKDVRIIRRKLEAIYKELKIPYFISKHISNSENFNSFRYDPVVQASISGGHSRVMNLIIPELAVKFTENIDALGNLNLSSVCPGFLREFFKLTNKIVDLINA